MNIVLLERNSVGQDVDVSCFDELGEVTAYGNTTTEEEVRQRIRDAEIVIANKAPLTRKALQDAKNLKMIGILATGYDICDTAYCKERGILVCNAVNYSTAMVAQHTITLALCLTQKIVHYDQYVKSGAYSAQTSFSNFDVPFHELNGKTWGIVGMGNIGCRVANIAEALGCRVVYHSLTGQKKQVPFAQVDKETLLRESDVISLHCPLSPLSRDFMDAEAFQQMKPSAVLINVARGPVVNQQALYNALVNGEIAGAAVDVLEKEPLPHDDPLLTIQDSGRLIITPHLAWASVEARQRCVREVYLDIAAFLHGDMRNAVNL